MKSRSAKKQEPGASPTVVKRKKNKSPYKRRPSKTEPEKQSVAEKLNLTQPPAVTPP